MINKDDIKNLIADYLYKRGDQVNYLSIDYCLNEVENGRGKEAFEGRLDIKIKNLKFNNWEQVYNDLELILTVNK